MGRGYPKYAVVQGRGMCRVLQYLGDGKFELLTKRDVRIVLHRDRFEFVTRKR